MPTTAIGPRRAASAALSLRCIASSATSACWRGDRDGERVALMSLVLHDEQTEFFGNRRLELGRCEVPDLRHDVRVVRGRVGRCVDPLRIGKQELRQERAQAINGRVVEEQRWRQRGPRVSP